MKSNGGLGQCRRIHDRARVGTRGYIDECKRTRLLLFLCIVFIYTSIVSCVVDMTGNEEETLLTSDDVAVVVQRYTNDKEARIIDHLVEDYSADKLGLLGGQKLFNVTFQRSNANNPETISLFMKVMPYNIKEQADFLSNQGIFVTETVFFNQILPDLTSHLKEQEKWLPTCYLAKEDAIVMEDLNRQGYKMYDLVYDNYLALKSTLVPVARLHSCSILMEARLSRKAKKPVQLNDHYPGIFIEKVLMQSGKEARFFAAGGDVVSVIAERLGFDPQKTRKAYDQVYQLVRPSDKYRNVICHGDLWGNNFMYADDSPLLKCVLIDFQLCRYVPLVMDLLQFFHLNSTRKFRSEHEVELVKFYHSELEKTIKNNDETKSAKVPSLEEIYAGMRELRVYGLALATFYLPLILLNPQSRAECTKDSSSYNNYVFVDRVDVTIACMEKHEFFRRMVEDAVIELAEKADELYK